MAVSSVTSSTAASAASTSTSSTSLTNSGSSLAGNFQAFLTLLTTQLKTNQNLDSLVKASNTSSAASVVSYIGTSVSASGDKADLSNGSAKWSYTLDSDAPKTTITIKDSSGSTVYTETKSLSSGSGTFEWNGKTSTGEQASDGTYQISIDAKDSSGKSVKVSTDVSGKVDGVDLSGSSPVLLIGSRRVALGNVKSVRAQGS